MRRDDELKYNRIFHCPFFHVWKTIREKEHVQVKDNIYVEAIRNNHVKASPEKSKSLGFQVYQTKMKLKEEYLQLPQEKLLALIREKGKENLTEVIRTNLLCYSGDTPVDDYDRWNNAGILIHEATFLEDEGQNSIKTERNLHSKLGEVLKMVSEISVETLILGHFSSRYSAAEIDEKIKFYCREFRIKIPVYRLLPGQIHRNILSENPLN